MSYNKDPNAVPGWVGGFAESNPAFAYPDPDLSSLPLLDNMANIPKIQRQQQVYWPEFSWETIQGNSASRCFSRFAHDISSGGYDDTGRIWSIICPQQGACVDNVGCLNVEVTVTGQRGWIDETNRTLAADLSVEGTIWFSPSAHQNWFVRKAWDLFKNESLPFPSDKANAIKVTTHKFGDPDHPAFPLRTGQSTLFEAPDFAKHSEAWSVANLGVQIGPIKKINHPAVDAFNEQVLDIFNIGAGNMLQADNLLTWNVWLTAPEYVNTVAWTTHAERWRLSIDVDHGKSPDGSVSSPVRYADGTLFEPAKKPVEELEDILKMIKELL